MYFLLKMGMFHCYVSLPECKSPQILLNLHHTKPDLMASFGRSGFTKVEGAILRKSNELITKNDGHFLEGPVTVPFPNLID